MSRIVLIGALAVVLALSGAALVYAQDSGTTTTDGGAATHGGPMGMGGHGEGKVCDHEGEGGHQGHAGGDQTARMQEMIDSGRMAEMLSSDHATEEMGAETAAQAQQLLQSGDVEGLKAFMEAQRASHHQQ